MYKIRTRTHNKKWKYNIGVCANCFVFTHYIHTFNTKPCKKHHKVNFLVVWMITVIFFPQILMCCIKDHVEFKNWWASSLCFHLKQSINWYIVRNTKGKIEEVLQQQIHHKSTYYRLHIAFKPTHIYMFLYIRKYIWY